MIFSYLTPDNIFTRYKDAKKYTDQLTKPFPDFERIARNRPFEGIDPAYPKTTDGTTASIVRKTPKRIVQQIPTGVVESDTDDAWLPIVAGFIYTNKILPYANEEYDLIQKCWMTIENGLTFGASAIYTPFLSHDGNFSPDMLLPYWGDIFLQRGKKSGYACSYIFMRSWWQRADLEALIDGEAKQSKQSKKKGSKYTPTWDVEALKTVLEHETSKDQQAMTPDEQERGTEATGIELVTAFQKGVGAKFYTFNPSSNTIVRTKTNKDPRGKMPIDWFYGDVDGNNPLGRGIVELIGGLQNLIDGDMQAYQYNRALALQPPVLKYGNMGKFSYAPNVVVSTNDPTAKIIPLTVDTTAIAQYPALYGLQKSQLLNLVNSPDTSISSEIGNPGFGKTPQALQQQKATISVDDNYTRKMFEAVFENWSETAVNLYFAERSGVEALQLDDETADKLRKLASEGKFDESQLSPDNKILIDYDTATPALSFRVDASTSKMKDDSDQLQAVSGLLDLVANNPLLAQLIPKEKILGAWNAIVASSGIEDPEEMSVDVAQFQKDQRAMMAQQQMQPPQPPMQGMQSQLPPPDLMSQNNMPQSQQQQGSLPQPVQPAIDELIQMEDQQEPQGDPEAINEQDRQIIAHLQALGIPQDTILQAINLLESGATADQVMQAIGVSSGQ